MTAREKFLQSIMEKIRPLQDLQELYNRVKSLPDDLFEELYNSASPSPVVPFVAPVMSHVIQAIGDSKPNSDYGVNKKTVIRILREQNRAMTKAEIISQFTPLMPDVQEPLDVVTNALAALSTEKAIVKYKPKHEKFKGFYWAFPEWMENGSLKNGYNPKPQNTLSKYL